MPPPADVTADPRPAPDVSPSGDANRTSRLWPLLSAASLAVLAFALVAFGWDRGPDVLIDYGRELYVPWRLIEGEHLYTDIAWFNGPAAPWIIEGWMRVFGVSLDALQALDTLVILAVLTLLVSLVKQFADGLSAWAAGVVFLAVFAVAQQEHTGNFLFLAPYSHGITFGFLFGLVAVWSLARAVRSPAWWPPLVAGASFGLAFLTKAEISLAVGAAGAVGLVGACASGATAGRRSRLVWLFVLGASLPIAATYARFALQIGHESALRALVSTWTHALDGRVRDLSYYREMRGMDDPASHLAHMARQSAGSLAVIGLLMAVGSLAAARIESKRLSSALSFGVAGVAAAGVIALVDVEWLLTPLPFFVLAVLVLSAVRWKRARDGADPRVSSAALTQLQFAVLAAALLPKILLLTIARQYGFVLTVPGTLLVVVALVKWLPDALVKRGASAPGGAESNGIGSNRIGALRAVGLAIVLAFTAANLNATRNMFRGKTYVVGAGADRIIAQDWHGVIVNAVVRDVGPRLEPGDTLLVLPEGIMINYLLRARTPTPVVNFMPPELLFFDEARIIAALEENPPAVVALMHRPTDVYGFPFFGDGFGESVLAWINDRYERVRLIGGEPFEAGANGAAVMLPRAAAPR